MKYLSGIRPLLEALLLFVIGLALLPVITSSTAIAVADENSSAAVRILVELFPLFYVLILLAGAIGYVAFRTRGK